MGAWATSWTRWAAQQCVWIALGPWLGGVVVPAITHAATPCRDMPGFESLSCRMAELLEVAQGVGGSYLHKVERASQRVDDGAQACATGDTTRAQQRLRGLRQRFNGTRRALDRAVRRGKLIQPDADTIAGLLQFTDALRRATQRRLERHPCPELVEILSPAPHEVAADDRVLLLFELAADADPGTVTISLAFASGQTSISPTQVSTTQGWVRVDCVESGLHTLTLSVTSLAGSPTDEEAVSFQCDVSGFTVGAEVELLIEPDTGPEVLRLTPVRPLRSGATYAVVVTQDLTAKASGRTAPTAAFWADAGIIGVPPKGAEAFYSADPNDPRNPFPSGRLVRPDGTIHIPDGFSARAVPDLPRLDGVRAFLRGLDALSEEHRGFSPSTRIVLTFGAPIKLRKVTPENLFLVEIANPGPAEGQLLELLDALDSQRGIPSGALAVASVFPVEDLAGAMATIRDQLASRAASTPPVPDFSDPDPNDAQVFGIFDPNDAEFAGFFGGSPPAGAGLVARGSFPSPDYRENGRFPERFLDGSEVPPSITLDFLLVLPTGATPAGGFPTVILQHGFGGDNSFVSASSADFAAAGLATIGINAPEHGVRGNFFDFFDFSDFNTFGNNFRQGSVDLLQLVQVIQAGVDVRGDPNSELRGTDLGYLGVSLGGVLGGVFAATEPAVSAPVLNVPGGRLAQFAGSTSGLATPFLASFAAEAGIPVRTCKGDPEGSECTDDSACAPGESCRFNLDFELMLDSALPNFQTQLDPGDGISYVRGFRIEPRLSDPRPVLIQEGIGDIVLANPLTEALARGIGLPANRADTATQGVAGLWRFPPPTGHGIFGLAEVRAQAITFLESNGTIITTP
ncbi:MAG: hypothetical protein IH800_02950 [Myxococcales bacterium]|nr:hypothetical protein [Myxococcales bacterium]